MIGQIINICMIRGRNFYTIRWNNGLESTVTPGSVWPSIFDPNSILVDELSESSNSSSTHRSSCQSSAVDEDDNDVEEKNVEAPRLTKNRY